MAKVILFQGDSITDAGRNRDSSTSMGHGYPDLVSAYLGYDCPGEYEFYNRGISGNRVLDLYARIVRDIINIRPDYMSILIGVNDIWHGLGANPNGTGFERYEKVYNILLEELRAEFPDLKIMILEPFVLKGPATESREEEPDRWEQFDTGVRKMAQIARSLADKHGLKFVELQNKFDAACEKAEPTYWLGDGVHPTPKGHELIKRAWLEAFEEIK